MERTGELLRCLNLQHEELTLKRSNKKNGAERLKELRQQKIEQSGNKYTINRY